MILKNISNGIRVVDGKKARRDRTVIVPEGTSFNRSDWEVIREVSEEVIEEVKKINKFKKTKTYTESD